MSDLRDRRCQEIVYVPGDQFMSRGHNCSNGAKVERNGKLYCGIHDPVRMKERRRKLDAKMKEKRAQREAEYAAERERDRRADLFPEMLAALELFAKEPCERPAGGGASMPLLTAIASPERNFDATKVRACGKCRTCKAQAAVAKTKGDET